MAQPVAIVEENGRAAAVKFRRHATRRARCQGPPRCPKPIPGSEYADGLRHGDPRARPVAPDAPCCTCGIERPAAIVVDRPTGRTSNPKYYAGGDCVNGGREVVDAVADGKRAAGIGMA